jgi:drug/metabolite transporter (DMT)-like permease
MPAAKCGILLGSMGVLVALITTAIWGFGFVATRMTLQDEAGRALLTPLWSNAARFTLALAVLTPIAWARVRRMGRAGLRAGLVLGVALYACFAFQTAGLARTSIAHSSFITVTYVIFVPLAAAALGRERLRPRHVGAALLALVGVALLTDLRQGGANLGDLLTLLCALACTAHILVADRAAKGVDALALNWVQIAVTLALSLATAPLIEGSQCLHLLAPPSGRLWFGLLYCAILSSCVAFTLQFAAQKRLSAPVAAMLFLLESPFGAISALLVLGERMGPWQWVGAAIILVASAVAATSAPAETAGSERSAAGVSSGI